MTKPYYSVLQIEILFHYATRATPFRDGHPSTWPPAQREAICRFVMNGFLRTLSAPPYYAINPKGREVVERLKIAAAAIATRVSKARPSPLSAEGARLIGEFEGFPRETVGYGFANWARGPIRMTFKPVRRPMTYTAEVHVPREQADSVLEEALKNFAAAGSGFHSGGYVVEPAAEFFKRHGVGINARDTKPAWVTPAWEGRFEDWKHTFTVRGMTGAFHRRLMDMLFAKTDKLRDVEMCTIVRKRIRAAEEARNDKGDYSTLRRAILDAERPK